MSERLAMSDCTDNEASSASTVASSSALLSERDRRDPMSLYRIAETHRCNGDLQSWRNAVELALERPHLTHEQRYYRARAKLTLGDWSGWSDYEARHFGPFAAMQHKKRAREIRWTHKAWDGLEDISNKTLLVLHEGTDSDAIQILRFVPPLASKARKVILETPMRLVPFVQHNFKGLVEIAIDGLDLVLTYDRYVWIMTLPAVFPGLLPLQRLSAPARKARPQPAERPMRAGVCWRREAASQTDDDDSIPLAAFAPVLNRDDVEWHNLQLGEPAPDAAEYAPFIASNPASFTFADLAAVIVDMDYVVTVDGAVCHLAGSLGVPTYLLLTTAASWRWGLNDTTPWYPEVRIIRQPVAGDWASVVSSLNTQLDERGSRTAAS